MSDPTVIADLLERVLEGDPWHGPNLAALLEGVTARQAAARPVAGGHSIWELVLHMTGWADEVHRRLEGRAAQEPDGGDWPAVGLVTTARWRAAVARLVDVHRGLATAVRAGDAHTLSAPVVDRREPALGTGLSRALTLHGLVHHTVYHSDRWRCWCGRSKAESDSPARLRKTSS